MTPGVSSVSIDAICEIRMRSNELGYEGHW